MSSVAESGLEELGEPADGSSSAKPAPAFYQSGVGRRAAIEEGIYSLHGVVR